MLFFVVILIVIFTIVISSCFRGHRRRFGVKSVRGTIHKTCPTKIHSVAGSRLMGKIGGRFRYSSGSTRCVVNITEQGGLMSVTTGRIALL